MKKFILIVAAVIMSAGIMAAQDMAAATEAAQNAQEAFANKDYATALAGFKDALAKAQACGEEGETLIGQCKSAIPVIMLSIGKEDYNAKSFATALDKVNDAIAVAKEYGAANVEEEATALIPKITLAKNNAEGTAALSAKDYAKAVECFKAVLETDPSNGPASLRLIQALINLDDIDGAKAMLETAVANGQEANAKKVIGQALLKKASANLKGGKTADALAQAVESTEFADNAQAWLIAGQAAQKLSKNNDAIKYFENYLEASPTASNATTIAYTVGALYQGLKNNAKAKEYYTKALSDPKLGAEAKKLIDSLK